MRADILKELRQLRAKNKHGDLVAEEVVAFAEDETTALHSRFEWDDSVAGHNYRLVQARNIIRVVVEYEPHTDQQFRAYVSLESTRTRPGGGYGPTRRILGNEETKSELLDMALKELNRAKEKYATLTELADVFAAIDAATAKAAKKAKKATPKATKKSSKTPRGAHPTP